MKKIYVAPTTEEVELIERYGVLENENSGVAGGESSLSKENNNWDDTESTTFANHRKSLWDD